MLTFKYLIAFKDTRRFIGLLVEVSAVYAMLKLEVLGLNLHPGIIETFIVNIKLRTKLSSINYKSNICHISGQFFHKSG